MTNRHEPIGVDDVRAAERILGMGVARTPLMRLNDDDAPTEIYPQFENLHPIGSSKIRGMTNAIELADPAAVSLGVWRSAPATRVKGWHENARRVGVSCTVVGHQSKSRSRPEAVRGLHLHERAR